MFLVLGLIPGTSIQLNFFEIILLPVLAYWLYYKHNYARVYQRIDNVGRTAVKSGSFRAFIIWAAMTIEKPRQSTIKQRLLSQ